jgi:hypothetical protein
MKRDPIIPKFYRLLKIGEFILEDCLCFRKESEYLFDFFCEPKWVSPNDRELYKLLKKSHKGVWVVPIERTLIKFKPDYDYTKMLPSDIITRDCLYFDTLNKCWSFGGIKSFFLLASQTGPRTRWIKPLHHSNYKTYIPSKEHYI